MRDNLKTVTPTQQNVQMGYLRACLTVLVIAHHAVLAYHPYAPLPPTSLSTEPMYWQAFPVVDSQRAPGVELLVGFNDVFFMSLMFLVSGLFLWPSLQRKGAGPFLRDRVRRLGIPFVVGSALLAPLAYFPTYLQAGGTTLGGFWQVWRSLPNWPSGPVWFLWVLLAFGAVAAALTRVAPEWGNTLGRFAKRVQQPAISFGCLVAASAVAYLPLAIGLGPARWCSWGPFSVQASRPLHYAVYFFAGAALGAHGTGRGLLAKEGTLARRWPLWVVASLGAFLLAVAAFLVALSRVASAGWWAATDATFVLSCAASSFAFLALFVRFARQGRVADSLRANAYGMYVTHYAFVNWLQYALLGAALSGAAKAMLVFLGAVALSWGLTAALRRIPAVARVLSGIAPSPSPGEVGAVSR